MSSCAHSIHKAVVLCAFLACISHARRVQSISEQLTVAASKHIDPALRPQSLVERSESGGATVGENPWKSPDVQRVLMLLCIMAIGFTLRARFPGKEPNAIQKLLLQFLVPATLFKGLSKESIELSHARYLGSGVLLILARTLSSVIVAYAALGGSYHPELCKLRRTAIFGVSTTASALSVLPFVSEFVGPEFVGLGGMVDLPMKMYMLILMPLLMKAFGEKASVVPDQSSRGRPLLAALLQIAKEPITVAMMLGIVTAAVTEGRGSSALGFAGKAIDALAGAQTPILFLLIGLKLNVQSSMPVISAVLLLANQGIMLIMVSILLSMFNPGVSMTKFIILFSQGAPSVVGLGVLQSAIDSGVQGYNPEFAFDLVAIAFPISSAFQCMCGLAGESYGHHTGIIGPMLLAIAGLLRVVFNRKFQQVSLVEIKSSNNPIGS